MPLHLRARFVFPVAGPPLPDGCVSIDAGRIVAVGHAQGNGAPARNQQLDLGNVALLPALVNAHVHLEFSDLTAPLGHAGQPFPDWIRAVVSHRRENPGQDVAAAIRTGMAESRAGGVLALGEIATGAWPSEEFAATPPVARAFYELIGTSPEREAAALHAARAHSAAAQKAEWRPGLSPHAPYTVSPGLLAGAIELAAQHQSPLAMHLAESPEEVEFLATGGGAFRELLESLGAFSALAAPRNVRPLDYLRQLARAPRAQVVHGNYLADDEIAFLASQRQRLCVVYCPRTHAYFGHAPHPFPRLLNAGARVALGTDGRSSNPDLSILAEMRHVARQHPRISPEAVLTMATRDAAWALGFDDEFGEIAPGRPAHLVAVALSENQSDPYEWLFATDMPVVAAWWHGALQFPL